MKSIPPNQNMHFIPIIIDVVCTFTGIPKELLVTRTRKREVVVARQMAMAVAKELTKCSLAIIGREIGGKDHATVLHAIKTIGNLCDTNYKFKARYEDIRAECRLNTDVAVDKSYVCYICGTRDVQIRAWIDANTRRIVDVVSDGEEDDCWCPSCQRTVQIIAREDYLLRLGIQEEDRIRRVEEERVAQRKDVFELDKKEGYDEQLKQLERELKI